MLLLQACFVQHMTHTFVSTCFQIAICRLWGTFQGESTMHNLSCSLWPKAFLAMFQKSKSVSERTDSDRPDKRLRGNVRDLFLSGATSAGRAAAVLQDAEFDGAAGVADLAVNEGKNAQRDLVRKFMKGSKWPPLYAVEIPVLHKKTHQVLEESINTLLPHEVLGIIMSWNQFSKQKVFDRARLSASARKHFEKTVPLLGSDPTTCIPLGLWTGGCPVKWDRSQSVIVITMSVCGQTDDIFSRLRIPLSFSQKLSKGAPLRNFSLPPSGFAQVINKKFCGQGENNAINY